MPALFRSSQRIASHTPGTFARLLLLGCCLLYFSVLRAAPLPPAGFGPDNDDSYFGHFDNFFAVELLDSLHPFSEFGFYYRGEPSRLLPLFDGGDQGSGGQAAGVNFPGGVIVDVDSPGAPYFFTPMPDRIGFYLTIDNALTLYSDSSLNVLLGGLDLFFAYPDVNIPFRWAMLFQGDLGGQGQLSDINLSIAYPLSPVPLPPAMLLFGSLLPLLWLGARRRRRH